MSEEYKFPLITGEYKNGSYEYTIPIECFEGCAVSDAGTGEFLGWVNAKEKAIIKYEIKEI